MSLGSPTHEGSVTSPRSPASGYGDHQSLMSSPQSGPVHYEMPTTVQHTHSEQVTYFINIHISRVKYTYSIPCSMLVRGIMKLKKKILNCLERQIYIVKMGILNDSGGPK